MHKLQSSLCWGRFY